MNEKIPIEEVYLTKHFLNRYGVRFNKDSKEMFKDIKKTLKEFKCYSHPKNPVSKCIYSNKTNISLGYEPWEEKNAIILLTCYEGLTHSRKHIQNGLESIKPKKFHLIYTPHKGREQIFKISLVAK